MHQKKKRKLKLKPEHQQKVFKLGDQLLSMVLDNPLDTEMIVYYLKARIKKN